MKYILNQGFSWIFGANEVTCSVFEQEGLLKGVPLVCSPFICFPSETVSLRFALTASKGRKLLVHNAPPPPPASQHFSETIDRKSVCDLAIYKTEGTVQSISLKQKYAKEAENGH